MVLKLDNPPGNNEEAGHPRVSETITSRDNRWIKQFRAALAGDAPRTSRNSPCDSTGLAGIEGARLLETALRSGVETLAVLVSETGARHLSALASLIPDSARVLSTTDRLFAHVSGTESPQGIAALVKPRVATFDDLVHGLPLVLVLAGVQDPGNVGTLIRTAEAFGATGAAACHSGGTGTANPHSPKALRSSAGSALRLPILRGVAAPVLLAQLRIAGVSVYAASPGESGTGDSEPARRAILPWEADWRSPAALLVGNEGAGLPPDLVRSADAIIRIPQTAAWGAESGMDSLNVAVAGAILLYEAARQRGLA